MDDKQSMELNTRKLKSAPSPRLELRFSEIRSTKEFHTFATLSLGTVTGICFFASVNLLAAAILIMLGLVPSLLVAYLNIYLLTGRFQGTCLFAVYLPALLISQAILWSTFNPVMAGASAIGMLVTSAVATSLLANKAYLENSCQYCGYNLEGNQSGICPECGTKPDMRRSTEPDTNAE